MANVIIDDSNLTDIADAIRGKNGLTTTYKPREMAAAITAIEGGGGGGYEPPEEAFSITGNCTYLFANGRWTWFVDKYANKLSFNDIDDASYMFYNSTLKSFPCDINLKSNTNVNVDSMFYYAKFESVPYVKGKINTCRELFASNYIKEIPEDWGDYIDWSRVHSYAYVNCGSMFITAHRLRSIPKSILSQMWGIQAAAVYTFYYSAFTTCYSLQGVDGLAVYREGIASNLIGDCFSSTFDNCASLRRMTFETNEDGTPYTANWKSQTIDLSKYVGYSTRPSIIGNGIYTTETIVTDDASYQALKDNPDYWTADVAYALYNHDSAVNTINSLPDTSAYLASAGGTNTIKFLANSGSATDGGAINTLTEEEIAVATAKGWTVSLV